MNPTGKTKIQNTNWKTTDGYRDEHRRIFGDRKPVKRGRYYLVDGKEVHEDDVKKKDRNPTVYVRVRDKSTEFLVKNQKDLHIDEYVDGGYRAL